jgi:hypothetical protein
MQISRRSTAPISWRGWPGLRDERKARQTGHYIGVYDAKYFDLDPANGSYVTRCEQHLVGKQHKTMKLAKKWAARPLMWCEECRAEKGVAV